MSGAAVKGKVLSATTIRVPGKAHAEKAPFLLLLVALDNGRRVLGHFGGPEAPVIDSRVVATPADSQTLVFAIE